MRTLKYVLFTLVLTALVMIGVRCGGSGSPRLVRPDDADRVWQPVGGKR